MILQPVLKGQLLELRPVRPADFQDLYEVASDPLIWEQHPHNNRYQEQVFRKFFRVIFVIGTQNFRSQKAVEKLGAVRVGSTVDSGGADCFVYRL
jgi:RimJ/RimL family protein N-acetyltransferase